VQQITRRLTFSNVLSAIAVFLVLGGTAFAAAQLGKNSVGTKQLKKNAVTKAKIKKGAVSGDKLSNGAVTEGKLGSGAVTEGKLGSGAVTEGKIKDGAVSGGKLGDGSVSNVKIQNGAVNGEKVADGSLSGADINSASTPFGQVVSRLAVPGPINMQAAGPTLLGTYTQPAGEDDLYFAGLDVTFSASCTQPRSAAAFLLIDPENPFAPEALNGIGVINDKNPGTVTKHLEIGDYGLAGFGGLRRMGLSSAQNHTFYLYVASGSCNSGSGITGSNVRLDVMGTE
jgi:hypothetical protein